MVAGVAGLLLGRGCSCGAESQACDINFLPEVRMLRGGGWVNKVELGCGRERSGNLDSES